MSKMETQERLRLAEEKYVTESDNPETEAYLKQYIKVYQIQYLHEKLQMDRGLNPKEVEHIQKYCKTRYICLQACLGFTLMVFILLPFFFLLEGATMKEVMRYLPYSVIPFTFALIFFETFLERRKRKSVQFYESQEQNIATDAVLFNQEISHVGDRLEKVGYFLVPEKKVVCTKRYCIDDKVYQANKKEPFQKVVLVRRLYGEDCDVFLSSEIS